MARGELRIVGRGCALQRLGEVLAASASGRPSAVLVSGEAGIGKTSLIRAAIGEAAQTDGPDVVGWGTCWQGEGAPGFWPWMQAFGDLAKAIGSRCCVSGCREGVGLLSAVLPEFGVAESRDRRP